MHYSGERMVPWNLSCGVNVMHHHVARYTWALPWVYGKKVVDLGSGTGYGSFMMSWVAGEVTGVEIDKEAVSFARQVFRAGNLAFEHNDVVKTHYPADIYVAFEVLEHLQHPEIVLERYSPILWSIPVSSVTPFHQHAYTVAEIDQLMAGSGGWYQGRDGLIVQREVAWFEPVYVLGVLR
jgi:SAM-dependent methyltransferase